MAQVLSKLNENFFDCEPKVRFDFVVKKFRRSSLGQEPGPIPFDHILPEAPALTLTRSPGESKFSL
jgi:hypothetical protein